MNAVIHIPIHNDPISYLESLRFGFDQHLICCEPFYSKTFLNNVKKLLCFRYITVMRPKNVKQILIELSSSITERNIHIHFPINSKYQSYMTDRGDIYIPLYFLYSSSGQRVLKVTLHEIAHWWLACQKEYGALLKEDLLYQKQFGKDEEQRLISPIEYYATILSCELMESILKTCDVDIKYFLLTMASAERQKVDDGISKMLFCQSLLSDCKSLHSKTSLKT